MKIGNTPETLSQIQTLQNTAQNSVSPAAGNLQSAAQVSPTSGDTAHLSTVSGQVTQATSASDVRLDKVAAVQSALAAGTYSVPASQVASKIVDSMLEEKL